MRWLSIILITSVLMGLTACNDDNKDQATAQKEESKKKTKAQTKQKKDKYLTAHYIEEELENMEQVKHTTVIIQGKDAFVAVELQNENQNLDQNTKNEMINTMRVTDPNLQNIYISDQPEFQTKLRSVANDIERGEPEKSIGESFNQTIRKIFPELKR